MPELLETHDEGAQAAAMAIPADRAGWEFQIPGACLHPTSKQWDEAQRASGITMRMVFLTAREEREAYGKAQRAGDSSAMGALYFQMQAAIWSLDGKKVGYMDREAIFEALGPQGRSIVLSMWGRGTAPSPEAQAAANDSFRLTA